MIVRGLGLWLAAAGLFAACVPSASMRPLTVQRQVSEVGFGAVAYPRPEPLKLDGGRGHHQIAGLQGFYHRYLRGRQVSIGAEWFMEAGTYATGVLNTFGGGGFARFHLGKAGPLRVAAEASAGWAYVGLTVPISLELGSESLYLYSQPGMTLGLGRNFRIPLGLAFTPGRRKFTLEGGLVGHYLGPGRVLRTENYISVGVTF